MALAEGAGVLPRLAVTAVRTPRTILATAAMPSSIQSSRTHFRDLNDSSDLRLPLSVNSRSQGATSSPWLWPAHARALSAKARHRTSSTSADPQILCIGVGAYGSTQLDEMESCHLAARIVAQLAGDSPSRARCSPPVVKGLCQALGNTGNDVGKTGCSVMARTTHGRAGTGEQPLESKKRA